MLSGFDRPLPLAVLHRDCAGRLNLTSPIASKALISNHWPYGQCLELRKKHCRHNEKIDFNYRLAYKLVVPIVLVQVESLFSSSVMANRL